MILSLAGKQILVTGATGGIGRGVVEAALEAKAAVFGSFHQDQAAASELEGRGVRMIQADLTDREQVRRLVDQVLEESGGLDGLVYAAGVARDHTVGKLTDQEWDEVLNIHLTGLFTASQAVLPAMKKKKQGKIVTLGSFAGLTGRVGQANYAAAKAGVVGFIKSLAREVGRFGISANVVLPGFVDSKMTRSTPPQVWERAKRSSAMGTISSVDVVASFTTWLLSDLCHGVTGQVFSLESRIA